MTTQLTYNYSAAEITSRCRQIIELVGNDMKLFAKFGVTEKELETLKKKISDYETFPEDKIFAERVSSKTRVKTEKEEILRVEIRNFLLHISIVIIGKQEMKKYFKSQKITGIPTTALIEFGEKVVTVSKKFKSKLLNVGLKEEDFENLKNNIKQTKAAVKELESVRAERVKNTARRHELGKQLYEKLVKFSSLGKNIWKGKDEEQYKRYLLYAEYYQKVKDKREQYLKEKKGKEANSQKNKQ
ncbi:MAG: hypothetical protein IKQ70_03975 [Bacteroidales bacterium]|nr:hypothetical protein [Bacteroidales bacterium]